MNALFQIASGILRRTSKLPTDDYAKDGGPGALQLLCSFAMILRALKSLEMLKTLLSELT